LSRIKPEKLMNTQEILTELIRRTTSDLPQDVENQLRRARSLERDESRAALMLDAIIANIELARAASVPMCQDTGTLTFFFDIPSGTDTQAFESAARGAVREATAQGLLRNNTIDTLSGESINSNVTHDAPVCIFKSTDRTDIKITLLQKGGGCENMSCQFSLPDETLRAGRDLDGVRRCLLSAVHQAQGYGCGPGILGVCIGSDRAGGYKTAKEQLLRPLNDTAVSTELAALEKRVLEEADSLGIGAMGLGGATTLLGVKIAAASRLPASYFVTVAYMCWACRRRGVHLRADGTAEWFG